MLSSWRLPPSRWAALPRRRCRVWRRPSVAKCISQTPLTVVEFPLSLLHNNYYVLNRSVTGESRNYQIWQYNENNGRDIEKLHTLGTPLTFLQQEFGILEPIWRDRCQKRSPVHCCIVHGVHLSKNHLNWPIKFRYAFSILYIFFTACIKRKDLLNDSTNLLI